MPINIKNPETEELARQLAKETGETITEVIKKSLQDRLQRVRGRRHARGLPEQVADILPKRVVGADPGREQANQHETRDDRSPEQGKRMPPKQARPESSVSPEC